MINLKLFNNKWRIEIVNEIFEIADKKNLEIVLKYLIDLKDIYGRLCKYPKLPVIKDNKTMFDAVKQEIKPTFKELKEIGETLRKQQEDRLIKDEEEAQCQE